VSLWIVPQSNSKWGSGTITRASIGGTEARSNVADGGLAESPQPHCFSQLAGFRLARGWTQTELAKKAGMKQSRISVLEDPSYPNIEIKTLFYDVQTLIGLRLWPARLLDFYAVIITSDLEPESPCCPDPNT
jgi:DNA-binding XRE family transcriptional regulator